MGEQSDNFTLDNQKAYAERANLYGLPYSYNEAVRIARQRLINYQAKGWSIEWGQNSAIFVNPLNDYIVVYDDGRVESSDDKVDSQ